MVSFRPATTPSFLELLLHVFGHGWIANDAQNGNPLPDLLTLGGPSPKMPGWGIENPRIPDCEVRADRVLGDCRQIFNAHHF
jgi:hypothetical protein